jgi:hypothetical protein
MFLFHDMSSGLHVKGLPLYMQEQRNIMNKCIEGDRVSKKNNDDEKTTTTPSHQNHGQQTIVSRNKASVRICSSLCESVLW